MSDEAEVNGNETSGEKKPQIITDEDWKSRVKAEDAALEEKLKSESSESGEESTSAPTAEQESQPESNTSGEDPKPKIDPSEIPPADFPMIVTMFSTQAMVGLGAFPNPTSGKSEPEPALAKHFIDLLGVLEEKTKGNLENSEQNLLDNTLHQLRMAYVEVQSKK